MKQLKYILIVVIGLLITVSATGTVSAAWTAQDLADNITNFRMGPEGSIEEDVDDVDFYYRRTQEEPELYLELTFDYQAGEEDDVMAALQNHLRLWNEDGNNIIIIDSIQELGAPAQTIRIDITSTVEDERINVFNQYDVMIVDNDTGVEEKIFDFERRPSEIWSEDKLYENITNVDMGPRWSVSHQEGNLYHYRSTGDGIYMLLDINYQSHELEAVRDSLHEYLAVWLDGRNEDVEFAKENIKERSQGQIEVTFTGIADGFNMGGDYEYDITMRGDSNKVLGSVSRMPLHLPPTIRGELQDYGELGLLRPDRIYYLNDRVGDFIPQITAADDYFLSYRIGGLTEVQTEIRDGAISFNQFDPHDNQNWLDRDEYGSIREGFNFDYIRENDDVDETDEFIIDHQIYEDQNVDVSDGFHGVRMKVESYGISEPQYANFYFVLDTQPPTIQAGILDEAGRFSGAYGDEFGTAFSPRPQLRVRIEDSLSGIESRDDVEVKYVNLDARDKAEITYDNFAADGDFDGFMDVINLDDREATRTEGEQVATIVPFSDLDEGEYMIKVSARDKAGNDSRDMVDTDETAEYIFYLEVDASQPEAYNIRFNHESQIEKITGTDALELNFDIAGIEDLIYAINYLDDDTEGWIVAGERELGLIRRRNKGIDFAEGNHYFMENGVVKDGQYEIRIIGDEEGFAQLETLTFAELDLVAVWEEEVREGRRDYQQFQFRVDGSPPAFDYRDIRYITGTGDMVEPEDGTETYNYTIDPPTADLVNDGSGTSTNFGVLYTDEPTFQMKFENLSQVRSEDIRVRMGPDGDERLARVTNVEVDDSGELNQYTIEVEPRTGLLDNNHNLIIDVQDIHGNTASIRYDNLFETSHIDGRIDFNVPEGRSTINEGSAFEIYLPDDLDTETLNVSVDGTEIIHAGDIVGEGDNPTRADDYYDNEDYYKADDYDSDGFDVMFFENKQRILVFIRMPITGKVEVDVRVENRYGDVTTDSAEFRVDQYRDGFGFGRLLILEEN